MYNNMSSKLTKNIELTCVSTLLPSWQENFLTVFLHPKCFQRINFVSGSSDQSLRSILLRLALHTPTQRFHSVIHIQSFTRLVNVLLSLFSSVRMIDNHGPESLWRGEPCTGCTFS